MREVTSKKVRLTFRKFCDIYIQACHLSAQHSHSRLLLMNQAESLARLLLFDLKKNIVLLSLLCTKTKRKIYWMKDSSYTEPNKNFSPGITTSKTIHNFSRKFYLRFFYFYVLCLLLYNSAHL